MSITRVKYLEELEDEFQKRFRLSKKTFGTLLSKINNSIKSPTSQNKAISPTTKLLLTLRFYATGTMLFVVADFVGVSEAAACIIIKEVTDAMAALSSQYICMTKQTQSNFYNIAKFPKVVGAIDCTLIEIQLPSGDNAEYYRCRKSWFAWNVQVICDANLRIRNIVAPRPGSAHDQTIFRNSAIKRKFELGHFDDAIILGDNGHALKSYLITPLSQPQSAQEILYNEAQLRTRNAFGTFIVLYSNR